MRKVKCFHFGSIKTLTIKFKFRVNTKQGEETLLTSATSPPFTTCVCTSETCQKFGQTSNQNSIEIDIRYPCRCLPAAAVSVNAMLSGWLRRCHHWWTIDSFQRPNTNHSTLRMIIPINIHRLLFSLCMSMFSYMFHYFFVCFSPPLPPLSSDSHSFVHFEFLWINLKTNIMMILIKTKKTCLYKVHYSFGDH